MVGNDGRIMIVSNNDGSTAVSAQFVLFNLLQQRCRLHSIRSMCFIRSFGSYAHLLGTFVLSFVRLFVRSFVHFIVFCAHFSIAETGEEALIMMISRDDNDVDGRQQRRRRRLRRRCCSFQRR